MSDFNRNTPEQQALTNRLHQDGFIEQYGIAIDFSTTYWENANGERRIVDHESLTVYAPVVWEPKAAEGEKVQTLIDKHRENVEGTLLEGENFDEQFEGGVK